MKRLFSSLDHVLSIFIIDPAQAMPNQPYSTKVRTRTPINLAPRRSKVNCNRAARLLITRIRWLLQHMKHNPIGRRSLF